jgi:outer membrane immunogenic protein
MISGEGKLANHEACMRRLLIALGLIASICGARAQEFELPAPPGSQQLLLSPPPTGFAGWGGIYFGGQVGYSASRIDLGDNVNDLAASILRDSVLESTVSNFTVLAKVSTSATAYGWFAGYNTQWEGAMLGIELNYNHTALDPGAADSVSVRIANDATAPSGHHFIYDPFTVTGAAAFHITDIATLRGRAGWTAGQFMPYAFLGVAVVRADVSRSATVSYTRTDYPDNQVPPLVPLPPANFGPVTQVGSRKGAFFFGYAAGLGLEVCLMPNVFLRGEWEFVDLQSMKANINSVRTGIGVKF